VFAGLGAGAIDAGLNTYAADNFSERQMQWLHASYGIGVTLGPLMMTYAVNVLGNWKTGYVAGGIIQLSLAFCFIVTARKWEKTGTNRASAADRERSRPETSVRSTLGELPVWKSLGLFFLYSGAEVTLGIWAYTILTVSRGVEPVIAGIWAGSYWATFTVGRIFAGFFVRRIRSRTLVLSCLVLALAGAVLFWLNLTRGLSLAGVAAIGFAIAPLFPAFVSATKDRVGAKHSGNTIGMQMSFAGLGFSVIPALAGVLAKKFSPEIIPLFLVVLFISITVLFLTFPDPARGIHDRP